MANPMVYFRLMFSREFTLTKKHLGLILLMAGGLAFLGIMSIDIFDAGREGGIGPAQQIALIVSVLAMLIGLTLIPLGKSPA
jgi:hypothetical protein